MPDAFGGRLYLYFDVVAEPVQAVHELAFGDIGEVTAKQAGHLGLRQSHAPTRFFLRQAKTTHGFHDLNNQGTERVAELAKKAGVKRFVYSSSCSVYGASDEIADENSPTNPLTVYAKCKILNEEYISKLADDKFSPVFLRNATAYGLSARMRFDLVINYLAGSALVTGEIKMTSDGNAWRPFVHVDDICRAMLHVLEAPKEQVHNKIFNVGGEGSNYTIKEISEIISEALPGCKITLDDTTPDKRNYRVDF